LRKNLILDLDGTLLFAENQPGALVVKGRRRDSYLAGETLARLYTLQNSHDIILATGRSLLSAMSIATMLSDAGIRLTGMVAENGGVWVGGQGKVQVLTSNAWIETTRRIGTAVAAIAQTEFATCLALLSPSTEVTNQARRAYSEAGLAYRLLPDGNKLFLLAGNINKNGALTYGLGVERLQNAAGAGNDTNDIDWLRTIAYPACTSCSKGEVKKTVLEKGGLVSRAEGHAGIQEILGLFSG